MRPECCSGSLACDCGGLLKSVMDRNLAKRDGVVAAL